MIQLDSSIVTRTGAPPFQRRPSTRQRLWPAMMALALGCWIAGCTGAQQTQKEEESAAPPLTFSAEQIHSPSGDMSARIPNGWVSVDAQQLESPQVFALLCNPEYTLSTLFIETPVDNNARGIFSRDGLKGLVDASFLRHKKRTNGRAALVGNVEEFAIGRRQFAAYTYSTDSAFTITRVAVFYTNAHLYECAITQLTFSGRDIPAEKALRSIHQLILGSIEW